MHQLNDRSIRGPRPGPLRILNMFLYLGVIALASITPVHAGPLSSNSNSSAQIVEYPAPTSGAMPLQIAIDQQSDVWFGEFKANKLVKRLPGGQMLTFGMAPASGPMNMWENPATGNVWFSAIGDYIVRATPNGATTTYAIPTPNSMPMGVCGDSKGNIWFAEMYSDKIGVVRPDGHIDEYKIPTPMSLPTGLTVDSQGNVWFAESGTGKIGVLRTDGTFNEYNLAVGAHPMGVMYSPMQKDKGLVWFTDTVGNDIGSITTDGKITTYPIPTPMSVPMMAMQDAKGNVWFTEMRANKIGRLRPDGKFSEYAIPTALSGPMGLAVDPSDGTVWFAETHGDKLGHLIPAD